MRHFLLILAVAALVGCGGGKKNLVEKTIRKELAKSEGGLREGDVPVSQEQSTDRCEGSGEAYAVNATVSRWQP